MHIPDGYLDLWISILLMVITIAIWIFSYYKIRTQIDDKKITLLGVLTAAIFTAQMINWQVGPGGTTAHLVGGALMAIFLGPYFAVFGMSIILIIQAFVFGDGGILALGANIWNMGIVDVFVGYTIYKLLTKGASGDMKRKFIGAFFGGWVGITVAAFFCGLEIGISTIFPYNIFVSIPVMTIYHGLLGIIEGFITAFVVTYVAKVRPELLSG